MFETNPTDETLSEFISDRYIQHSVFLPNGRQPLAELFGTSVEQYPVVIDVHKVIVVGDWAMAHVNFRWADTDLDGIEDSSDDDIDGDGIANTEEVAGGTFPYKADSDGDGIDDPTEIEAGTDPVDPRSL